MAKEKILVLVNPVSSARTRLTINKSSRFPPIALGIVAALTSESWRVKLIDENWEPFVYQEADLVGISAFTASVNRAYEIAAIYRQRGIPVVMGGIHASMCPQEALQFVDAVVIGEAESVWSKVITDMEEGRLQRVYHGEWTNLSGFPYPRRDLFHPEYMLASIQTSRGCPMDCEFCSVTAFNGRRYRRRPPKDVLAELEQIPQKILFFLDDNIIGYGRQSRQQALAIFRGMVERRLEKWWICQASLNFANDDEMLHWASKAGCRMVFLGLETEDICTLKEINKQLNLTQVVESYKAAIRRLHRAGIAVLGAFIFGMDSDTPETLRHRADYIIHSGVDAMQMTFLTPLPGTRLFNRLLEESRLLYTDFPKDWERYGMTEVTYQPQAMESVILEQNMRECYRRTYAWPVLARKAMHTFYKTQSWMALRFAWQSNINYRNVALANSS